MSNRTSRRLTVGAGIAAAVLVAVGIGWALAGPDSRAGQPPAAAGTPSTGGLGGPGTPTPAPGAPGPDAPDAPGSPADPTPAAPGGTAPPASGPRIEQFQVTGAPQCPGGTDLFPVEGQPVVLAWQVTGADQVTLSVDGPGAYGSYPATGGETLDFGCAGAEGDIQEHTYQLSATADGVTVTETLVVTAEVHQRTDT